MYFEKPAGTVLQKTKPYSKCLININSLNPHAAERKPRQNALKSLSHGAQFSVEELRSASRRTALLVTVLEQLSLLSILSGSPTVEQQDSPKEAQSHSFCQKAQSQ